VNNPKGAELKAAFLLLQGQVVGLLVEPQKPVEE
jgi:hypothetical protein